MNDTKEQICSACNGSGKVRRNRRADRIQPLFISGVAFMGTAQVIHNFMAHRGAWFVGSLSLVMLAWSVVLWKDYYNEWH